MNNEIESTSNKTAFHNTTVNADSGEIVENHHQKEKLSFTESDKGPYSMFSKNEKREQVSTGPLMTLLVCKILDQSAIKYDLIVPVTWQI
jgi:hypothetical protein